MTNAQADRAGQPAGRSGQAIAASARSGMVVPLVRIGKACMGMPHRRAPVPMRVPMPVLRLRSEADLAAHAAAGDPARGGMTSITRSAATSNTRGARSRVSSPSIATLKRRAG